MDLGEAPRRRRALVRPILDGVPFGQQGEAFRVRRQHRVQQGRRARRRFLPDLGHAGAAAEADRAAVHRDLARDGAQQRAFAGAVAAHQADAPPGIDAQVGAVQQGAAGDADRHVVEHEQTHGPAIR